MTRLQLNLTTTMEMGVTASSWWNDINESTFWQDRIFYSLCAVYALVSAVALVSLSLLLPYPIHLNLSAMCGYGFVFDC